MAEPWAPPLVPFKADDWWAAWTEIKRRFARLDPPYLDEHWQQAAWIKYKVSTDKVLQIEPKEELKARTGKSPDFFEAFMLTFSTAKPQPGIRLL